VMRMIFDAGVGNDVTATDASVGVPVRTAGSGAVRR
jgi:hypothetical protein